MKAMSKRYQVIFNLLALSVIIFLGVDIFYRIVYAKLSCVDTTTFMVQRVAEPKKVEKPRLDDYHSIIDRNIFGSTDRALEKVKAEEIEDLEPTSLKIALLGTVTGSEQNAFAVIEETDKRKQGLYKVGDTIQNATIRMILRGKVILRVDGRDEILTMEEAAAQKAKKQRAVSRPPEGISTVTVRRTEIEKSLRNLNKLLSQVRIRPYFKGGKPHGLALSNIKRGSVFEKLGLKDGDIVQGVNNRTIRSPDDIMAFYRRLKSGSHIAVRIDRKGQLKTINYRFE